MVTNLGETVLHLAVKYNQFDGLKYLIDTLNIQELVNVQDNNGNTVLHIATAGKLTTVIYVTIPVSCIISILTEF